MVAFVTYKDQYTEVKYADAKTVYIKNIGPENYLYLRYIEDGKSVQQVQNMKEISNFRTEMSVEEAETMKEGEE